jgi:hypothetical protein
MTKKRKPGLCIGIDPDSGKYIVTVEHDHSYQIISTHDSVEAAWAAKHRLEQVPS